MAWLGADWDQLAAEGIAGVNMLYDTTAFVKRADLPLSGDLHKTKVFTLDVGGLLLLSIWDQFRTLATRQMCLRFVEFHPSILIDPRIT